MSIAGVFFPTLSLIFLGLSALFGFVLIMSTIAENTFPPIIPPMFASSEYHAKELKRLNDSFNAKIFLGIASVIFAVLAVVTVFTV